MNENKKEIWKKVKKYYIYILDKLFYRNYLSLFFMENVTYPIKQRRTRQKVVE